MNFIALIHLILASASFSCSAVVSDDSLIPISIETNTQQTTRKYKNIKYPSRVCKISDPQYQSPNDILLTDLQALFQEQTKENLSEYSKYEIQNYPENISKWISRLNLQEIRAVTEVFDSLKFVKKILNLKRKRNYDFERRFKHEKKLKIDKNEAQRMILKNYIQDTGHKSAKNIEWKRVDLTNFPQKFSDLHDTIQSGKFFNLASLYRNPEIIESIHFFKFSSEEIEKLESDQRIQARRILLERFCFDRNIPFDFASHIQWKIVDRVEGLEGINYRSLIRDRSNEIIKRKNLIKFVFTPGSEVNVNVKDSEANRNCDKEDELNKMDSEDGSTSEITEDERCLCDSADDITDSKDESISEIMEAEYSLCDFADETLPLDVEQETTTSDHSTIPFVYESFNREDNDNTEDDSLPTGFISEDHSCGYNPLENDIAFLEDFDEVLQDLDRFLQNSNEETQDNEYVLPTAIYQEQEREPEEITLEYNTTFITTHMIWEPTTTTNTTSYTVNHHNQTDQPSLQILRDKLTKPRQKYLDEIVLLFQNRTGQPASEFLNYEILNYPLGIPKSILRLTQKQMDTIKLGFDRLVFVNSTTATKSKSKRKSILTQCTTDTEHCDSSASIDTPPFISLTRTDVHSKLLQKYQHDTGDVDAIEIKWNYVDVSNIPEKYSKAKKIIANSMLLDFTSLYRNKEIIENIHFKQIPPIVLKEKAENIAVQAHRILLNRFREDLKCPTAKKILWWKVQEISGLEDLNYRKQILGNLAAEIIERKERIKFIPFPFPK